MPEPTSAPPKEGKRREKELANATKRIGYSRVDGFGCT
jgi:hypothetical protein